MADDGAVVGEVVKDGHGVGRKLDLWKGADHSGDQTVKPVIQAEFFKHGVWDSPFTKDSLNAFYQTALKGISLPVGAKRPIWGDLSVF